MPGWNYYARRSARWHRQRAQAPRMTTYYPPLPAPRAIRVTKVDPNGMAPEWVEKEWVGVELEAVRMVGYWRAPLNQALGRLGLRSPSAVQWYREHMPDDLKGKEESSYMVFPADTCKVVASQIKDRRPDP